jgi:Holliday junction resolvase RusA-like endonuclease
MIKIEINHDPVAWTAPRLGRNTCYSPHTKYREIFHAFIRAQYKDAPLKDYVRVDFVFYFPMPKSTPKKKQAAMLAGKIYPTKSDCTNLQKFAEDCLKKIVIEDDRNVVQISSKKLYALSGKVEITIRTLEEMHAHHH